MSNSSDVVVLGRFLDPYGLKGWVRLHPFGDDPLSWKKIPAWLVGPEKGPWQPLALLQMKEHGEGLVALLESIADRTAAEALRGLYFGALKEDLPTTSENEFYWADLIGLTVINQSGQVLGTVVSLLETGANDVLTVQDAAGDEKLLPFVDQVIISVSPEEGVIRVDWGLDW